MLEISDIFRHRRTTYTSVANMTDTNAIPLFKMNGAGNKILVADTRGSSKGMTGKMAAAIGDNEMLHFDQMMVMQEPQTDGTEVYVKIYNIDGSEAEACGNGTRCVADILMSASGASELELETSPGILNVVRQGPQMYTVDMGVARFGWADIPLSEEFRDTRAIELQVGPIDDPILHSPSVANMGNPHAIFWVENDVETYGLERFGPLLENHPVFPERANISLARVISDNEMDLKVWERGTGLTLACGSAACASVACGFRTGRTGSSVIVHLPGGDLRIDVKDDYRILMTGPIEYEAVGMVDLDTLEWQMVETNDPFQLVQQV